MSIRAQGAGIGRRISPIAGGGPDWSSDCKHGTKGCDKSVVMGHKTHIHGEVAFDQKQGLWFMSEGWEQAAQAPATKDFFGWLKSQHNGLRPGQSAPQTSR